MALGRKIDALIEALQALPGVGPKSAQRMALALLQRNREGGRTLSHALADAMDGVRECGRCRNFAEGDLCRICADERRDPKLCVVESPADIIALEQAGGFHGTYFVLHGRLSPLDGVGPAELRIELLERLVREKSFDEVILATNPTVEGEATAHYIAQVVGDRVSNISRIAHGVPLGGELEYIDGGTLVHAMQGRRKV